MLMSPDTISPVIIIQGQDGSKVSDSGEDYDSTNIYFGLRKNYTYGVQLARAEWRVTEAHLPTDLAQDVEISGNRVCHMCDDAVLHSTTFLIINI